MTRAQTPSHTQATVPLLSRESRGAPTTPQPVPVPLVVPLQGPLVAFRRCTAALSCCIASPPCRATSVPLNNRNCARFCTVCKVTRSRLAWHGGMAGAWGTGGGGRYREPEGTAGRRPMGLDGMSGRNKRHKCLRAGARLCQAAGARAAEPGHHAGRERVRRQGSPERGLSTSALALDAAVLGGRDARPLTRQRLRHAALGHRRARGALQPAAAAAKVAGGARQPCCIVQHAQCTWQHTPEHAGLPRNTKCTARRSTSAGGAAASPRTCRPRSARAAPPARRCPAGWRSTWRASAGGRSS